MTSAEEIEAQTLIEHGEIDQAIAIYQRLQSNSGRILHILASLFAEKKDDQHSAIDYYQQALIIKEENGDDLTDTLIGLAIAYHNLGEFDSAFVYHLRALTLRESKSGPNVDQRVMASSLLGLAKTCCAQEDFCQALIYAQRALTLNMSILSDNDRQIASNLAILANIYHQLGDDIHALDLAEQALALLERCSQTDSSSFVTVLNNIGTIQLSAGRFNDALLTFVRLMQIYNKILPEEHPTRVTIEENIRRMTEIQENNVLSTFPNLWNILCKFLLL